MGDDHPLSLGIQVAAGLATPAPVVATRVNALAAVVLTGLALLFVFEALGARPAEVTVTPRELDPTRPPRPRREAPSGARTSATPAAASISAIRDTFLP